MDRYKDDLDFTCKLCNEVNISYDIKKINYPYIKLIEYL